MESIPETGIANVIQSTMSLIPTNMNVATPKSFHGSAENGSEFAFTAGTRCNCYFPPAIIFAARPGPASVSSNLKR